MMSVSSDLPPVLSYALPFLSMKKQMPSSICFFGLICFCINAPGRQAGAFDGRILDFGFWREPCGSSPKTAGDACPWNCRSPERRTEFLINGTNERFSFCFGFPPQYRRSRRKALRAGNGDSRQPRGSAAARPTGRTTARQFRQAMYDSSAATRRGPFSGFRPESPGSGQAWAWSPA